jgi:hypothetical protein
LENFQPEARGYDLVLVLVLVVVVVVVVVVLLVLARDLPGLGTS